MLIRLFRKYLQLPLSNPEILSLLIQILSKEGLIGTSYIYDSVKTVIDEAFDGGQNVNYTLGDGNVNALDTVIPALSIYRPSPLAPATTSTATGVGIPRVRSSSVTIGSDNGIAIASAVTSYSSDYERIFYMMNR